MKIGIDCRMIQHSGIGVRIQHLLHWVLQSNKNHHIFLFGDPKKLGHLTNKWIEVVEYKAPIYSFREWFGHPLMKNMDILDIPHFNVPFRYLKKCIVTIHDLTPIKMIHFFSPLRRCYMKIALFLIGRFAQKVVCVSGYTQKDLIQEGIQQEKTVVIYNGISTNFQKKHTAKELRSFCIKYSLPEKILLTVGISKGHKNLDFLMDCLGSIGEDFPVVIAGTNGNLPGNIGEWEKKSQRKIILLPRIPDEEMPLLYQSAELLIFPSLYEGFGFPPLEAQASGCMVASSNAASMPEILGEGAIYFHPENKEQCVAAIQKALTDRKLRKTAIDKGKINSGRFSWKTCALETIANWEAVATKNK